MIIPFEKYHGTGNDFIIIDNRKNIFDPNNNKIIKFLCDRKYGIGADGLMLLNDNKEFDFEMKYFNSDGLEGTMCGNGGRCIVMFAKKIKLFNQETKFLTIDGIHYAEIRGSTISLKMNNVNSITGDGKYYMLNTGSPHYVTFRDNLDNIDVIKEGREVRNKEEFKPGGINVNFVKLQNSEVFLRTYERGVENETLSCGTGVIAAAIVSVFSGQIDRSNITIKTKGGELNVSFSNKKKNEFSDIILSGPAKFVFKGEIEV